MHQNSPAGRLAVDHQDSQQPDFNQYHTIRRDGSVVAFEPTKISIALTKAFLAATGPQGATSSSLHDKVTQLTNKVVAALVRQKPDGGAIHIEDIQDQVELALMRAGEHDVARDYVLYRERRAQARAATKETLAQAQINVVRPDGSKEPLDLKQLRATIKAAAKGLTGVDIEVIVRETLKNVYDGVRQDEVNKSTILAARALIEKDPAYNYVTARLLMNNIRLEILGESVSQAEMAQRYPAYFPAFIQKGIDAELLDPRLADFDLARLGAALKAKRDDTFGYLGLQTLFDRYFLHVNDVRIEMPQAFFMRVAMGLALNERDREARAIEFYNVLSTFDFMSSTPTLFNSGTRHSQLSSCYLTTIADDLEAIYDGIKDNALLSKFAGGLGNDWNQVRALGSHIKGTNGKSQGVVPFLKVVNDTAVAVNQGGKRKGAVCAYLETWHADIEEFLDLRKNTGDDRRRTHDMNTANWIPDLFMKRVMAFGHWSLFSPSETPDLRDLYGAAFEKRYAEYEAMGERGELKVYKRVEAATLWRKMLTMLFETGHPWITFKDPCNIRSPQQHVGVVHSSNLCTEITLNTSATEIAVCNLGSVNLAAHMVQQADGSYVLDQDKLKRTIRVAMRMLDNVIDINFYPVDKARNSNLKHRPVGMGIMGFQDALHIQRIPYASEAAVQFAGESSAAFRSRTRFSLMTVNSPERFDFTNRFWNVGSILASTPTMFEMVAVGAMARQLLLRMPWAFTRARNASQSSRTKRSISRKPPRSAASISMLSCGRTPRSQRLPL
jgi:ribonucleoside-diphosphate reductase alpha chain